jgi:methyl-accepting chemotaxis protein
MLIGLLIVARRLQEKVMPLIPEVQGILGVVKRTLERVEKHIEQIGTTSTAILDMTKQQLARVDELLGDATTRAKVQMERAEMVLDDTMARVQHTVSYVQSGVLRPVREVYGVLAGIRTALSHLGRSGRPTVDHATSDEEMFI